MKITYREVNGYLIPNLKLPPEEANVRLGKWGMLYKDYLLKHKKAVFSSLLAKGKLFISIVRRLRNRQGICMICL